MTQRRKQRAAKYRTVGGLTQRIERDGRSAMVLVAVAVVLAVVDRYAAGHGADLVATGWWASRVMYACLAGGAFNLFRMSWDAMKLARLAKT